MKRRVILIPTFLLALLLLSCTSDFSETMCYEGEDFSAYVWAEHNDLAVVLVAGKPEITPANTVLLDPELLDEVRGYLTTLVEVTGADDPLAALIGQKKALRKTPFIDTLALLIEEANLYRALARIDTTTYLDLRGSEVEPEFLEEYIANVRLYQMRRKTKNE
ncbi:MAG: hypothetical protein WC954_02960 [Sphaerochaeta sp.]